MELVSGCCDSPRFGSCFTGDFTVGRRRGRRASCAMIVRGRRGRTGILDWFPSLTRESATGSCISNRLDFPPLAALFPIFLLPLFFFFSLPLRSREVVEPILIRLRAVEKRAPGPKVRDRSREFLYLTGILIYKYAPAFEEPSSSPPRSEFFSEVEKRTLHPAFLTRKELERGIDFLKFAPIEARLI